MYVYCKLYYKQNLYFHPPYCTTARSQPFASNTFCLQTVPFCTVSSQLRHGRSLTASSVTPSSLVNPGSQLADCQWTKFSFFFWWALQPSGSLCKYPAQFIMPVSTHCCHYSTQNHTNAQSYFSHRSINTILLQRYRNMMQSVAVTYC